MSDAIHTHLTHEVEDFATWKQHFDAGSALRDKHGIKIHGVYQDHENPNMVTVHGELAQPDSLQNFMADPEGMPSMQKAGVKGRPDIKLMRKHA